MKQLALISVLFLSACSRRPSDGLQDGQIVYIRASCQKVIIRDWNRVIGVYDVITQKGDRGFAERGDLVPTKAECINWSLNP